MLKPTIRDNYVIVCMQSPDEMEELAALVKEHPGKQIMLSIGYEVSEEEVLTMIANPLDGYGELDNLLSFKTIGGNYSGDTLMRRSVIPPTPSHNPKADRYGQVSRKGKRR